MKTVLDYDSFSRNILSIFYPIVDTRENITKSKYDIIICTRDNMQDEFIEISQFANDNTKIIVDLVTESGCLDDFIDQFGIISKNYKNLNFYLLVDGTFNYKFPENVRVLSSLKLSLLAFFENFSQKNHNQQYTIESFDLYNKENGVTSLNGRLRAHRVILLLEMINRKFLFNAKNNISFLFYTIDEFDKNQYLDYINGFIDNKSITGDDYNKLLEIVNDLPIVVNEENGKIPSTILGGNSFKKIINLVTESVVGLECGNNKYNTITVTEKTWIPFKIHQIPVYISQRGYVNELRSLGFDLFDDIVDHGYDNESSPIKRIKMAMNEVEKLSEMDLIQFYKNNYIRFIKNNILCQTLKGDAFELLNDFILENQLV
jgi:hypothetical protein